MFQKSYSSPSSELSDSQTKWDPADCGLSPSSVFEENVDIIFNSSVSLPALGRKARSYLSVLEAPAYLKYNEPPWAERVGAHRTLPAPHFTVKRLFEAMYATATEFHLERGLRWAYAATCTCGGLAYQNHSPEEGEMYLAQGLANLAETWVAYFLWPVYPDYVHPEAAIRDWDYEARTDCKEDIMRRDDYTCFITHALDLSTPDERSQAHGGWKANLEPCPIVKLAATAIDDSRDHGSKTSSKATTFDILRHYMGDIQPSFLESPQTDVCDPENALLLHFDPRCWFSRFGWCLMPTNEPHKYHIKYFTPGRPFWLYPSLSPPDSVTFHDHSDNDIGVQLPSPVLLKWHAVIAHVMNLSGAAGLFFTLDIPPGGGDPAVPSHSGADFVEHVIRYDGDALSKHAELVAAAKAMAEMVL